MRTELPGSRSKPQTAAQDLATHIALGKIVKLLVTANQQKQGYNVVLTNTFTIIC